MLDHPPVETGISRATPEKPLRPAPPPLCFPGLVFHTFCRVNLYLAGNGRHGSRASFWV